jgi:hypothetical protein
MHVEPKARELRLALASPPVRAEFIRTIYAETQSWARHNETLIIGSNTVLLTVCAALFGGKYNMDGKNNLLLYGLALCIGILGLVTTNYLSKEYRRAICRIVAYERYFWMHVPDEQMASFSGCYCDKWAHWGDSFVPKYLHSPPAYGAKSSLFFLLVHTAIVIASVAMLARG